MSYQLDFCKKCKRRQFDPKQGIVCGLTSKKPEFISECPDFERDSSFKDRASTNGLESSTGGGMTNKAIIGIVLAVLFIGFRIALVAVRSNNRQNKTKYSYPLKSYQDRQNEQKEIEMEYQEILDILSESNGEFISIDTLQEEQK